MRGFYCNFASPPKTATIRVGAKVYAAD